MPTDAPTSNNIVDPQVLKNIIRLYKVTKSDYNFNAIFNHYKTLIGGYADSALANYKDLRGIDRGDITGHLYRYLLKLIEEYDEKKGEPDNYFKVKLKCECINIVKDILKNRDVCIAEDEKNEKNERNNKLSDEPSDEYSDESSDESSDGSSDEYESIDETWDTHNNEYNDDSNRDDNEELQKKCGFTDSEMILFDKLKELDIEDECLKLERKDLKYHDASGNVRYSKQNEALVEKLADIEEMKKLKEKLSDSENEEEIKKGLKEMVWVLRASVRIKLKRYEESKKAPACRE